MKQLSITIFILALFYLGSGIPNAQADTEKAGNVLTLALPAVAFGSSILVEDNHTGSIEFIKEMAADVVVTESLKHVVSKRRPDGECCDSFPSGHSSVAFASAGFIQRRYGWRYSLPAYIGATYVGYSRVKTDKHDTIDVVAGAVIGMLSSYVFVDRYRPVVVTPLMGKHFYGARVDIGW